MRDIKFRSWDKHEKEMFYDVSFIKSGDEGNNWICLRHCEEGRKDSVIEFKNPLFRLQIHLMQYIGRKDKNNNEIYEGDL